MTLSTHCRNGHEYTPRNTIRSRRGHRVCRQCKRDNKQRNKKPVRERIPLQASPWTSERIAYMRDFWEKGYTASAIARLMNYQFSADFTRDAVIGKAHRLKLTPRRSPIRKV